MIAIVVGLLLVRVMFAVIGCVLGCVQAGAGLALDVVYWAGRGLGWLVARTVRGVIRRQRFRTVAHGDAGESARVVAAWMDIPASRASGQRASFRQHAVLAGVRAARV